MVATWNPAASAEYYTTQTGYYTQAEEPKGYWYAPSHDFGLTDGKTVKPLQFERLFNARGADGRSLIKGGDTRMQRVAAFDMTFSAPRSPTLIRALGDADAGRTVQAAHKRAVDHALNVLNREAIWARRGHGGGRIEKVTLSAACFQHNSSRPAEHEDGSFFADPNLHTHAVILNLASRTDGSTGAIHSKILRDWKMAAGAVYHAAFAAELQSKGFEIDRVKRNGTFEIRGVSDAAIHYFSARRNEIESELADQGLSSDNAVALAASIARRTRKVKMGRSDAAAWKEAASARGFDIPTGPTLAPRDVARLTEDGEKLFAKRLAALPRAMTETKSVVDRRELFRSVAEALVGTSLGADRIEPAIEAMLAHGHLLQIGQDAIGLPRYSTPEVLRIEREVVAMAQRMLATPTSAVNEAKVLERCRDLGLSSEQTAAALAATGSNRITIISGAAGTGKTTTLLSVVPALQDAGYQVFGEAAAWRVANALAEDLNITSRASASWQQQSAKKRSPLNEKTVLLVEEAGLSSSRQMHDILQRVERAGARLILLGDRKQLQPISAGSGLSLVARAIDPTHIQKIVRQHEPWMRTAVTDFGRGDALSALMAFKAHDRLVEANGRAATIRAAVDRVPVDQLGRSDSSALLIARTNAEVSALSREVRSRLKLEGKIVGSDTAVDAVTASGNSTQIALAPGDRIRFLLRDDGLGVVNGTLASVHAIQSAPMSEDGQQQAAAWIDAEIDGRRVRFCTRDISDEQGRARIGWAYATTVYGAQGTTVEKAVVLLTTAFDRHQIYVASSRARQETLLVFDRHSAEQLMESGISPQAPDATGRDADRLALLASRLSTANMKETTLDAELLSPALETGPAASPIPQRNQTPDRSGGYDHAL
jgi:conjugative relaxase-like TrwC/TraI family protein